MSTELDDLANKINVSFKKLDDYRATSAKLLAEAKAACKTKKIPFKTWITENIQLSYGEARRLAKVGQSPNPVKALEDLRTGTRNRVKAVRKVALRSATSIQPQPTQTTEFSADYCRRLYVRALKQLSKQEQDAHLNGFLDMLDG